jgi:metal-responsive CopG/Arc/MetJ family transcriptional regulator
MTRVPVKKRGRPKHADDPPVLLSTSIPQSVDHLLRELSQQLGRPRSELIADAVRAYARRYPELKPMKK